MSELTDAFRDALKQDKKLKKLFEKAHPSYIDADNYAIRVGEVLGDTVNEEVLDELRDLLEEDHRQVSDYTQHVQESLNHDAGLNMRGLGVATDKDRLDGLVTYAVENAVDDKLKEFIINYNQNVVASTIKRNAEFQSESGLQPKIKRTLRGKGCEYCRNYAGVYNYPDDVPDEVYRRHPNCRCTVEYYPGNGRKQDVWSKKYSEEHAEEIQERRINNINYSSRRIVDKLSKKYVANGIKSNKIKDEINVDKQLPHLEQTAKNNRSYIYGDLNRAKKLYDKYKGTGYSLIDTDGKWNNKEFVNTNEKIGRYSNEDGSIAYDSRQLVIIYSKTGVHIYPGKKRYYD